MCPPGTLPSFPRILTVLAALGISMPSALAKANPEEKRGIYWHALNDLSQAKNFSASTTVLKKWFKDKTIEWDNFIWSLAPETIGELTDDQRRALFLIPWGTLPFHDLVYLAPYDYEERPRFLQKLSLAVLEANLRTKAILFSGIAENPPGLGELGTIAPEIAGVYGFYSFDLLQHLWASLEQDFLFLKERNIPWTPALGAVVVDVLDAAFDKKLNARFGRWDQLANVEPDRESIKRILYVAHNWHNHVLDLAVETADTTRSIVAEKNANALIRWAHKFRASVVHALEIFGPPKETSSELSSIYIGSEWKRRQKPPIRRKTSFLREKWNQLSQREKIYAFHNMESRKAINVIRPVLEGPEWEWVFENRFESVGLPQGFLMHGNESAFDPMFILLQRFLKQSKRKFDLHPTDGFLINVYSKNSHLTNRQKLVAIPYKLDLVEILMDTPSISASLTRSQDKMNLIVPFDLRNTWEKYIKADPLQLGFQPWRFNDFQFFVMSQLHAALAPGLWIELRDPDGDKSFFRYFALDEHIDWDWREIKHYSINFHTHFSEILRSRQSFKEFNFENPEKKAALQTAWKEMRKEPLPQYQSLRTVLENLYPVVDESDENALKRRSVINFLILQDRPPFDVYDKCINVTLWSDESKF